jgi:membrane-bound ClpP family serine protease
MSDVTKDEDVKKKKLNFGSSLSGPSDIGAFAGFFIIQGIISLVWGITKSQFDLVPENVDQLTAVSTQEIAQMATCLYGVICIIGGMLMLGVDKIIEALKPTGRKPTIKGWASSIVGAAFMSFVALLPFFIIFSIIKH